MRPVLLLLLTCNAHALRTPHPLLSNAAARTYRAAAATHFAQIMPLVKPSLLAASENKTEDRAAGKAALGALVLNGAICRRPQPLDRAAPEHAPCARARPCP